MDRYISHAWVEDDDTWPDERERPTITVHEREGPAWTGLVDASGVPIYRVPSRVPMGYRPR